MELCSETGINNHEFIISTSDNNQDSNLYELMIPSVKLNNGKINEIELSLVDQSNPHKGMTIEGLEIRIN